MPLDPRAIESFDPGQAGGARDIDLARRILALERALAGTTGWVPGDVKLTGKASPDPGWLLCNGAAVSRTTYDALFAAIGTGFGAGDGSTTFNVPDLAGRVPFGAGTANTPTPTGGTAVAKARGAKGGEDSHFLAAREGSVNDLGSTKTDSGSLDHLHNAPAGNTGYYSYVNGNPGVIQSGASFNANAGPTQTGVADRSLAHAHTLTARNADNAHNTLPPYQVLAYVIRY